MSEKKVDIFYYSEGSPSSALMGILIIFGSYAFLLYYIGWVFADLLPEEITIIFPSKIYRVVLPLILIGTLISYILFNWVSWQI
jgi:hypothetical protein